MPSLLLELIVSITTAISASTSTAIKSIRSGDHRGQATAEYALVLLGAAALALALVAWAAKSGAIGRLFDAVIDKLLADVV
ncbi:MAG: DUF4244 domain-containing protein [Acidimicrobiales bacterium]|nr:DUF4244 domain-containing protein [Acidimicrobiales bacterium]